jgi:dienelactone hydrolase
MAGAATTQPAPDVLPDTAPLTIQADFAADMVAGIGRYLDRKLDESITSRAAFWHPDCSSREAYERSITPNREHLARIIGVIDQRVQPYIGEGWERSIAQRSAYSVKEICWPVVPGIDTEGLLVTPTDPRDGPFVIAVPDADQPPERLLDPIGFVHRLALSGCTVYVPTVIDRGCEWSGNPRLMMTNMPHREWIYRMSFEAGQHIIGYEVQKVLAVVDRFKQRGRQRIGVIGYGEGGLIAMYAAALEPRIDATAVCGYFQSRQGLWQEPVYRNVWGLLREFGDAEIAAMIAPRPLIIEAAGGPEIAGPPSPLKPGGEGQAASGRLTAPPIESVIAEHARAAKTYASLNAADACILVTPADRRHSATDTTLSNFLARLGRPNGLSTQVACTGIDVLDQARHKPRLHRQFDQLVEYTQKRLRESQYARKQFWSKADASTPETWAESCKWYRDYFHDEVIGRAEPASLPANPRTRKILDEPKFTGYEIVLDVWPDVFAYGVLLLPKDLQPGERRPVVVCQHGLEGRPDVVVDPRIKGLYHSFGAKLADEGFIVFAPQNPYIGGDSFRILQRKANPLKLSLFSIITRQHERILQWLAEQPCVDAGRIGFYGISYGGKTAMRVPALLPQYALSICSADFNEFVFKVASPDYPFGFMYVNEYEVVEFNLANTFNHGEMAGLIAPRPFMVERGHNDPVATDEWVSYEYAKVRRLYDQLGIGDRTTIEYFMGGHEINGVGTFEFLHKQLNWPK